MTAQPGPAEFARLARRYPVVPVWCDVTPDPTPAPVDVFAALGGSALLENLTGAGGRRYAVIGLDPVTTLLVHDGRLSWTGDPVVPLPDGASLAETLAAIAAHLVAAPMPDAPPLATGGAIGVLGGDALRPPGSAASDRTGPPDSAITFPQTLVIIGPDRTRLVAPVLVTPEQTAEQQYAQAVSRLDRTATQLAAVEPVALAPVGPVAEVPFDSEISDDAYRQMIEAAHRRVRAGDLRQVTISRRFVAPARMDAVTAYRALSASNPSPYPYLLRLPGVDLVGASPQGLVRVRGGEASAYVIAGTRPRGADPEADAALAAELRADPKERDEHAMLVELALDDLAGVARPGSVRVADRERIVRYSRVMHLATEVTGTLALGRSALDALWAVFPPSTVAGMPRAAAVRVIEQIEPRPRGLYGGAVGYLDFAGGLDLCLGIRTMQLREGMGRQWPERSEDHGQAAQTGNTIAYVQAGAGVVAGSVPEAEVAESRAKASALFAVMSALAPHAQAGRRAAQSLS